MNTKVLIAFVLGIAAGGAAGYYIGVEKTIKEQDEEIRRAKNHYKMSYEARLNEAIKANETKIAEETEKKEEKEAKKVERTAKIPNVEPEYDEIVQKTNYNSFSKTELKENIDISVKEGPYEVQPGIFDDFIGIDRHDLTYFAEDEIVMDSHETIWNDAISKIGEENLDIDKFGRYEPDIIYIINEDYGEGYKISLDMGSYSEYMAGVEGL